MKYVYHSSKTPNIKILEPRPNNGVDGESVIFAIEDPLFAVVMSYGTGNEIAVGYHIDLGAGERKLYVDELEKNTLNLLDNKCYLYKLSSEGFLHDQRLMGEELISYNPVEVISVEEIPSALKFLQENSVEIVEWEDVPRAMKNRGKDPKNPQKAHDEDRFTPTP